MADFIIVNSEWSIGASTDTKPPLCQIGHKCYEYDTQKWFVTHDYGSTWTETHDLNAIETLIGEIQASPTANTVLARLKDIKDALALTTEASVDAGTATGGSNTTIVDTAKNWETDCWKNALVEVVISGVHYLRNAASNTADTITIAALPGGVTVAAGNTYQCKIPIHVTDIERIGGTTQTGRDWSTDFANLDIALSALRDAIQGASTKDLTTVEAAIAALQTASETLQDVIDGIAGPAGTTATLNDVKTSVEAVTTAVEALQTAGETLADVVTAVDAVATLIGEVQASPTANTVLARLKDLLTGIVLSAGLAIIGQVGIDQTTPGTTNKVISGHDITGIANNRKVVTTAATAVALAASTAAKYVVITAETDNTGVIVVGGSGVVAALATRQGTPLNPGASMGIPIDNLADVYIDSTVSGDGVTFTYLT